MLVYMISLNGLTAVLYLFASLLAGNGLNFSAAAGEPVYWLAEIVGYVASFILTIFLMSRGYQKNKEYCKPESPWLALSLPVFFAAFFINNFIHQFFTNLFYSIGIYGLDIDVVIPSGGVTLILFIIQYTLLPAILEEQLFRNVLLGRLRKYGDGFAILFSSFIFALMHHNIVTFPGIFLLGVLFSVVTIRSKSLIPATVMHFLNNAIATGASYLEQYADPSVTNRVMTFLFALEVVSLAVTLIWLVVSHYQARQKERATFYRQYNPGGRPLFEETAPEPAQSDSPQGRISLGKVLSSGWMIAFLVIAVSLTLALEFLSRITEQINSLFGALS